MRSIIARISPLTVVCATAILVVASSAIANHFLGKRTRAIDPRVTMEGSRSAEEKESKDKEVRRRVVVTAMDGEVARTANRAGEAQAVAIATSLYAATEQIKGRTPRTVNDLLAGVVSQNLLPPGLALTQGEGAMASAHSNLFVRYRPVPLAIEVLALGREPRDGPALLVRVPDDNAKDGGASLFMATRIRDVNLPPAFAPASEVISAGWSLEPLRSLK
ncbi:MAG TPA: hypothetical protein VJ464_10695 [Blastocatellia bacterium]|nr:hypothetical protein [Blastocatellia bacterium]